MHARPQHAEAVDDRAAEADFAAVLEIFRRAGDFADAHPERVRLDEHLVVEDEIGRIRSQRQRLDDMARERAIAGVELGELGADNQVLQCGEKPVGNVFVTRHAAWNRGVAENARADYDVVHARRDHCRHRGDQLRLVLVIRMQHDDDVGAFSQRQRIASLLVGAVAAILRMPVRDHAEAARHRQRRIVAGIIDQQHRIDDVTGNLKEAFLERFLGAVRRHHHDDLLSVQHGVVVRRCAVAAVRNASDDTRTGHGRSRVNACSARHSRVQSRTAPVEQRQCSSTATNT